MTEKAPETRLPCPVCLGVLMDKTPVDRAGALVVDHCRRCGGVWFEKGELERLRSVPPATLFARLVGAEEAVTPRCHACHAHVERREVACPACGHEQRLECPVCAERMRLTGHGELRLDVCAGCESLWFDHHELKAAWRIQVGRAVARRSGTPGAVSARDAAAGVAEMVVYAPDLTLYAGLHMARAAAELSGAALGSGAGVAGAAGAAAEVAGEAAAGIFEVIVDIIGGVFG